MVAVVGRLFQKWFPASPNLAYTFIWDKTDAYNQRVYGLSEAVGTCVMQVFCIFTVVLKTGKHISNTCIHEVENVQQKKMRNNDGY